MRTKNYNKTDQHIYLKEQIKLLKQENQKLKKRFQKMQEAMHMVYLSKKKYKIKYKQVKQKLDILDTIYKNRLNEDINIHRQEYNKNKHQNLYSRQTQNVFSLRNPFTKNNGKQDLTSNTFQTIPSSRKSQIKYFFNKNKNQGDLKQSKTQYSQGKDVGKIFKFKSPSRMKYESSGSQKSFQQNNFMRNSDSKPVIQKQRLNPLNYQINQNSNSEKGLKYIVELLLNQFRSLSKLKGQENDKQKQEKILESQYNIKQKLEEISQKLREIQKNQQLYFLKSQKDQRFLINNKKSQRSIKRSTSGNLNTSFLKTIEEIGKDLTQWKVDYFQCN